MLRTAAIIERTISRLTEEGLVRVVESSSLYVTYRVDDDTAPVDVPILNSTKQLLKLGRTHTVGSIKDERGQGTFGAKHTHKGIGHGVIVAGREEKREGRVAKAQRGRWPVSPSEIHKRPQQDE
jgi:hypothetical protein